MWLHSVCSETFLHVVVQNPDVLYKTLLITAQVLTFPPDKRGSCSSSRMRFQTFQKKKRKKKSKLTPHQLVLGVFLLAHELFPFCSSFLSSVVLGLLPEQNVCIWSQWGSVPIQLTKYQCHWDPDPCDFKSSVEPWGANEWHYGAIRQNTKHRFHVVWFLLGDTHK